MKLLLVFAAVLFTVSTAPHNEKKPPEGDENSFEQIKVSDLPKSINWVEKGAVTSVKNQGQCGCSYAFSAAGALEALFYFKNKTLAEVSEQELIDCSINTGCDGGHINWCFYYVSYRPGINSNQTYPYLAYQNYNCLALLDQSAGYCTGYVRIPQGNEEALLKAVATIGPISAGLEVDIDFMIYNGGIFKGKCGYKVNHGVLIVGYGTDNVTNEDYWLVKNSWGTTWGEKGFARLKRNINVCGIANTASYPVYDPK